MTKARKVADGYVELTRASDNKKVTIRVDSIESFEADGDNTILSLANGNTVNVLERYDDVDNEIAESGRGKVR